MSKDPTYQIVDWDENFESSESRKIRKAQWVRFSNKHDGLGFRTIAGHSKRSELYAGWKLIAEVASKMPTRGTLHNGKCPLTAHHLSIMTGFPAAIFELCFQTLTEPTIGWLTISEPGEAKSQAGQPDGTSEQSPDTSGSSPGPPGCHPDESGSSPDTPVLRRREEIEEKRVEESTPKPPEGAGEASSPVGAPKRETRESVKARLRYPEGFEASEFAKAFEDWVDHRMSGKKAGKTWLGFFEKQLDIKCVPIGYTRALAMVRESTAQGWTGLHEPKANGNQRNRPPTEEETDQSKFL